MHLSKIMSCAFKTPPQFEKFHISPKLACTNLLGIQRSFPPPFTLSPYSGLCLWLLSPNQGEAQEELPERLIGSARIVRPDLERSEPLDYD